MTQDEIAKLIPANVVEAAARAIICTRVDADVWPALHEARKQGYRWEARASLAAGLAAWGGRETVGNANMTEGVLILPLNPIKEPKA